MKEIFIILLLSYIDTCISGLSNVVVNGDESYVRRIKVTDDITVHVVSNFLPQTIAEAWQEEVLSKWNAKDDNSSNSSEPCFLYTTNDRNKKIRSLGHIEGRRKNAWRMKRRGYFSYGKWEMNPDDLLLAQMSEHMLSKETVKLVSEVLSLDTKGEAINATELSDLFVTHFTPGDFLSSHCDFYSGTYAFILSLTAGLKSSEWSQSIHGGELALECNHESPPKQVSNPEICHIIPPLFNQLVLFPTRPGPLHCVKTVVNDGYSKGFRRFAVTGWYMGTSDSFSEKEIGERNKMRAKKADEKEL